MNKIILIGRLTRNPEIVELDSGKGLTKFTLAVDKQFRPDAPADFFDCSAWEKTGEFCSKWFSKGQKVAVVGRMESRKYEDRDGNNRTAWDVTIESAHFADSKKEREPGEDDDYEEPADDLDLNGDDDDLPF